MTERRRQGEPAETHTASDFEAAPPRWLTPKAWRELARDDRRREAEAEAAEAEVTT